MTIVDAESKEVYYGTGAPVIEVVKSFWEALKAGKVNVMGGGQSPDGEFFYTTMTPLLLTDPNFDTRFPEVIDTGIGEAARLGEIDVTKQPL